jgi:hypothetical protein
MDFGCLTKLARASLGVNAAVLRCTMHEETPRSKLRVKRVAGRQGARGNATPQRGAYHDTSICHEETLHRSAWARTGRAPGRAAGGVARPVLLNPHPATAFQINHEVCGGRSVGSLRVGTSCVESRSASLPVRSGARTSREPV